ncbi:ATP-binding protein [Mucilaginibacter sp. SP1R1]|uniref:ATP-binding protein n=1 Tax=Mucilaginibacter sp. SP1R1 TaxID=2723091 RepID=UPI0016123E6C|nr:ATP-binding protein [Mucilaginibacter sp. SP1R1]
MFFLGPRNWLILLLLFFHCAIFGASAPSHDTPVARGAVINLRNQNFNNLIDLRGEWLFNWHELISPGAPAPGNGILVNFPELWSNEQQAGQKLPAFGYATYRLTVLLPKHTPPLRISVPDVYSAYRLFVNGQIAAENGQVSTTEHGFVPHWEYRAFDVPTGTDSLWIVWQVANFVHSKGGVSRTIIIGQKSMVELNRERAVAIDLLLTGCLLMGGLFFLGLYLFGNRDKAILLFALYAMVYSYRMIGTDNYILHTLIPQLNWYLAVRMEYISLFAGIGLFGFYSRYLYPEDQHSVIVFTVGGLCALFILATLLLPPSYFTMLINPFLLVAVFCLVYIPYLYIIAYRRKREGSGYALASGFALMFVFAISLLHYWGVLPQLQIFTFCGYVCFFFLQSLVLSRRVSFVLKKAGEQAAQGLNAKAEFLSTMSHEIRTPLNSVVGMSHLLLKNDPREDQLEQLNVMIFSANNLLNIVNDILDYSKIEEGMITFEHIEMNIAAVAGNVVTSLQNAATDKGITLSLETDDALKHMVFGDPTRTSQVITNLVHNAIKFTTTGGVFVSIHVQAQTDEFLTLAIRVRDTGIGISKEKQNLIFERFTQADSSTSRGFGGTGLGLAISKRILELQQSELRLVSDAGSGSTFYFIQHFPKGGPVIKPVLSGRQRPADPKSFSGKHILLVDDNPMNVMVAETFLKRWGAIVNVAENGQQALDLLQPELHELVLMDLHMPVMDGYESARRMRENGIDIPIIALTATLPSEAEDQLIGTGINDILVKPFLPDELYRKVFSYLSKREQK